MYYTHLYDENSQVDHRTVHLYIFDEILHRLGLIRQASLTPCNVVHIAD